MRAGSSSSSWWAWTTATAWAWSIRDIKLENTLLDASPKPLVKITDFGYCKASNDSLPKSKVGTPGYTGDVVSPAMALSTLVLRVPCGTWL